jgi:hypothetical protein
MGLALLGLRRQAQATNLHQPKHWEACTTCSTFELCTSMTLAGRHRGGEILDLLDGIFWQKQMVERFPVEPAVRGFAQGAVVQVEVVDIYVCFQIRG